MAVTVHGRYRQTCQKCRRPDQRDHSLGFVPRSWDSSLNLGILGSDIKSWDLELTAPPSQPGRVGRWLGVVGPAIQRAEAALRLHQPPLVAPVSRHLWSVGGGLRPCAVPCAEVASCQTANTNRIAVVAFFTGVVAATRAPSLIRDLTYTCGAASLANVH